MSNVRPDPEPHVRRLDAFKWFTEKYPADNFTCYASDILTITALCAESLGITVLPSNYSHHNLVKLFKVKPEFKIGLWVLSHTDLRHVIRIRIFSEFIYKYLKKQHF